MGLQRGGIEPNSGLLCCPPPLGRQDGRGELDRTLFYIGGVEKVFAIQPKLECF